MEENQIPSGAKDIIDFVVGTSGTSITSISKTTAGAPGLPDTIPAATVPDGKKLLSVKGLFEDYRTAPDRKSGVARLTDLASLIAHVNRTKDSDSALFASQDRAKPSLMAVYDYNRAGGDPRFGRHRAAYDFPLSDEWKAWIARNGSEHAMSQSDFAAFIEDRLPDLLTLEPDPAGSVTHALSEQNASYVKLLGGAVATASQMRILSEGLEVHSSEQVSQITNLATGEGRVFFQEQHQTTNAQGQAVDVPKLFVVAIPVFREGARYQVVARLRYRKVGGMLAWFYELFRIDERFDSALREACDKAATETSLPLFYGAPEA